MDSNYSDINKNYNVFYPSNYKQRKITNIKQVSLASLRILINNVDTSSKNSFQKEDLSDRNHGKYLPCYTLISTGTCPYRGRCKYIHDWRITTSKTITVTKKQNTDAVNYDSFFWPPSLLDYIYQPNLNLIDGIDRFFIESIWYHFIMFIKKSILINNPTNQINIINGRPRLSIFVKLSLSLPSEYNLL